MKIYLQMSDLCDCQVHNEERQRRRRKRPAAAERSEFLTPRKQPRLIVVSTPASGGRWIGHYPSTDESEETDELEDINLDPSIHLHENESSNARHESVEVLFLYILLQFLKK